MPTHRELANAVRVLAMDAVQKAKSGHPGAPMGMADMAEVLWNNFLVHNPANPKWWNRDRFVLSNGHASMLLYAVLHLTGYNLSMDDLKNFRQLDSKTPGHPEFRHTPGVETTTGPLGQGIATAVGMALAEKLLATEFNKEKFPIIDHYTYVFLGDGCMMEGLSHEACSLAGTLKLDKLIALWDNNGISIDGNVTPWFAENTVERFKAYGWHVEEVDGQDAEALKKALSKATKTLDKPSLISCRTTIAYSAPTKAGTAASHGSPLGDEEIAGARKLMNWTKPPFEIPTEIYSGWDAKLTGKKAEDKWNKLFAKYKDEYAEYAERLEKRMAGNFYSAWRTSLLNYAEEVQKEGGLEATRNSSLEILECIAPHFPSLFGGSADLTGSVCTKWSEAKSISCDDFNGRYLSYGVREFAMGAIMNGLALYGGFIPYGGTFLVFSDYAKNAIRLAALMEQQVIWVLTHDSIGVGEDGPTHQPIEQLATLRLTPNVHVWRPCDKVECAAAWMDALRSTNKPSCLSLSRQNLPVEDRSRMLMTDITNQVAEPSKIEEIVQTIRRGGYILRECKNGKEPELILIATGSEVSITTEAAKLLENKGVEVRVVSMPCAEVFEMQDVTWRSKVLPLSVRKRIAIEAAAGDWWRKYVGLDGAVIAMNGYGKSAPGNVLFNHYGFTVENIVKVANKILK